jgi:hypothetical protein
MTVRIVHRMAVHDNVELAARSYNVASDWFNAVDL